MEGIPSPDLNHDGASHSASRGQSVQLDGSAAAVQAGPSEHLVNLGHISPRKRKAPSRPSSSKATASPAGKRGRGRPKGTARSKWGRPSMATSSEEEEEGYIPTASTSKSTAVSGGYNASDDGQRDDATDYQDNDSGRTTKSGRRVSRPAAIVPSTAPACKLAIIR